MFRYDPDSDSRFRFRHQLAFRYSMSEVATPLANSVWRKLDKKIQRQMRKKLNEFFLCHATAIEKSLALASRQSYAEASEFFTAFAKALNKKPEDEQASNFHRTTTRVYWLMLTGWRSVERLDSVHELQQALCMYLEPHVVGSVKRIEKICQRLGLSSGASAGR